ncbi:hypothetical protein JCM11491_007098 [Sporobolomyces phaffii]
MPPKRNQKSKQNSKQSSKAPSKAPSGAATPAQRAEPVQLAPGLLGLNFGQSFSSVAIIDKEGLADCIANDDGERQIASALSFNGTEVYSGVPARAQLVRNASNTILAFRDLLGKSYDEVKDVKQPCNSAPIVDSDGKPAFTVEIDGKPTTLTVHEVVVRYLRVLLSYATDFLGRPVTDAVLTVPSAFTSAQTDALLAAAQEAGITVVQTLPESAAALAAYQSTEVTSEREPLAIDRNAVVLDVGATSTTATVVAVRDGLFHPLATVSDANLGGNQLDEKLMDFFGKEFTKKTRIPVEASNHRAQMKLRLSVEVTKKSLSASNSAPCSIESLAEGMDFHGTVNRMRFDLVAASTYAGIIAKVEAALAEAKLDPLEIHEVVLVGGTTKLPALADKLAYLLSESVQITSQIEPDEVVAKGAALHARSLAETFPRANGAASAELLRQSTTEPSVVAPAALAKPLGFVLEPEQTDVAKLAFVTLLDRDTPLPARRIVDLAVPADKAAKEVVLALWEGEAYVKVTPRETKVEQAKGLLSSMASAVKGAVGGAKKDDDEFSDSDDEDEEIKTVEVKPTQAIADLVIPVDATKADKKVRVTIVVDSNGKGSIEAKQLVDGAKSVETQF